LCHKVETWQTQVIGFVAYTIAKIKVLVNRILRLRDERIREEAYGTT
jgi:hypothetical protein